MPWNAPASVDVFCRVIDNFGDAGVCLRLARQLVVEHGCTVRLFCDQPAMLLLLDAAPPTGLVYLDWASQCKVQPASGVVSGFGCNLDAAYLQAMTQAPTPPRWLHLDYLSAEAWVEGTHGLDSRHPRLGLVQRFCYPGFTPATGGLLKEKDCAPPWSEVQSLATLARYGIVPAQGALRVLVFAYAQADFAPLIAASKQLGRSVHWLICHGEAGDVLAAMLGPNAAHSRLPFVHQSAFDALLRSSHRAWVRGEDSAIRAIWAGVPSVWQFYAQADHLHLTKMHAYLQRMANALAPLMNASTRVTATTATTLTTAIVAQAHAAANGALSAHAAQSAWDDWLQGDDPAAVARAWRAHLLTQTPSLAAFCAQYLQAHASCGQKAHAG